MNFSSRVPQAMLDSGHGRRSEILARCGWIPRRSCCSCWRVGRWAPPLSRDFEQVMAHLMQVSYVPTRDFWGEDIVYFHFETIVAQTGMLLERCKADES